MGCHRRSSKRCLENFEKLKGFGGNVFDGAVRYVLDGADEAVLSGLACQADAANALGLQCSSEHGLRVDRCPWSDFLETIEPVDCRFYLRLGKLFAAAAQRLPAYRFFCECWFNNGLWLEILLQEGTETHARCWSSRERKTAISGPLIEDMLRADGRSPDAFVVSAFRATERRWENTKLRDMVLRITNIGKTYAAHRDLLAAFLRQGTAQTRLIAVENLTRKARLPRSLSRNLSSAPQIARSSCGRQPRCSCARPLPRRARSSNMSPNAAIAANASKRFACW